MPRDEKGVNKKYKVTREKGEEKVGAEDWQDLQNANKKVEDSDSDEQVAEEKTQVKEEKQEKPDKRRNKKFNEKNKNNKPPAQNRNFDLPPSDSDEEPQQSKA